MPDRGSALVNALKAHQEIYVRSRGVVGHRLLLDQPRDPRRGPHPAVT